jgi:Mg2+/Co2+ transporter CorC
MEEIVGEIIDEYDAAPTVMIKRISDSRLEANAKISLEELEEHVGKIFSDEEKEEFNTLSGLIVSIAGHIPHKHSILKHESGFEFKVISADRLKVNLIEVYFPKETNVKENGQS